MKLTTAARECIAEFGVSLPAQRAYPIHDENHARDALARVRAERLAVREGEGARGSEEALSGIDSGDSGGVHANAAPMAKRPM